MRIFIAIPFAYTNAIVISAGYHDISLSYPAWKHPESESKLFDLYR